MVVGRCFICLTTLTGVYISLSGMVVSEVAIADIGEGDDGALLCFTDLIQCCRDDDTSIGTCLLYTSPSPRDATLSRMPSSA